jgi:tRNA threonylcarbamoyl adenosine modification protein (Sua5/YciO/YrdC/YwlC family)
VTGAGEHAAVLEAAIAALVAGAVVGIPTDTVYGLAVDPRCEGATGRVFALKRRPATLELPVLVADIGQAQALAGPHGLPDLARGLAERFWPGPLTIVVDRRAGLEWEIGGAGRTIGLRCPAHALARALCERVGPLATTSANRHGEPELTSAASVVEEFGPAVAVVIDGGVCDGTPSTVVAVDDGTLRCLREGAVPWGEIGRPSAPS